MFKSKKPNSLCGIRQARKSPLHTDVSHSRQCSRTLNTLLHVFAERAIHLSSSNGWTEFWPEPIKFLVDMPNHAH